jgi:hypothetical protein
MVKKLDSEDRKILLITEENLRQAFMSVLNEKAYVDEILPSFEKDFNTEVYSEGLYIMLALAFHEYSVRKDDSLHEIVLNTLIPKFVDKLVVDKEMAEECKQLYEDYLGRKR